MNITVTRINNRIGSKEYSYSIIPSKKNYEITLIVISNWRNPKELIGYAQNKIGYCDSDNGLGIDYYDSIDFETTVEVPEGHIIVYADAIDKCEYVISELNYLKILSSFFYSRDEIENTKKIANLINSYGRNK